MLNLKTKLATGLAAAGLLGASMSPVAALAVDVSVVDNGAFSKNHAYVSDSTYVSVHQSNSTNVQTGVHQSANTGGNSQKFNTGDGGAYIDTGNAKNNVSVRVQGGTNTVDLPEECLCEGDGATVKIKDNGAFSHNGVKVSNKTSLKIGQHSYTNVGTYVGQKSNTGDNKQWFNTGDGLYGIGTGNAKNNVSVSVHSGDNEIN